MSNSIIVMGGITNPAGSDTQIQFNNSGVFGADANFTWDSATNVFTVKDLELSHSGHDVTIENIYAGGDLTLMSGYGNAGGNGGTITIKGGLNASNNPSRTGGDIIIQGGDSGSTLGSTVSIKGGTATSGNVGDVEIQDIIMPKPVEADDGKAITYDFATSSYVMTTISAGSSVGTDNEIQLSDGSGGFTASNIEIVVDGSPGPRIRPITLADGLVLQTKNNSGGVSGQIEVITGVTNANSSGAISLATGNSETGGSGGLTISTGQCTTSGDAGNILIGPGTSSGGNNGTLTLECGSNTLIVNAAVEEVTINDTYSITAGTLALNIANAASVPVIGLFGATPVVQPTTSVTAASFTANTSSIADDTATFDGYTIGQVVAALRSLGILA